MERQYFVYILASGKNGTLYIGVTNDLARRVWEHRNGTADGFTKRYSVTTLVHIEMFSDITEAIAREKAMKKWRHAWKIELIEQHNPEWRDLFETINS
jgi:putative endonuclease